MNENDVDTEGKNPFSWSTEKSEAIRGAGERAMEVFARRHARSALSLYEQEGAFELSVPATEIEAVAAAFRDLGCGATVDRAASIVSVVCPRA